MFEHGCMNTGAVLGVLYTCVLYFGTCTCSAQLNKFHKERCSRNKNITIITAISHIQIKVEKPNFIPISIRFQIKVHYKLNDCEERKRGCGNNGTTY